MSSHRSIREASAFLIAAVSYEFGDQRGAALLSRLAERIPPHDMDRLAQNAAYHELEPLLYLVCRDCPGTGYRLDLPPELSARWAQVHSREMARTTLIQHGAVKALDALEKAGVRTVPLKGFYLASRYYERKSARGFKDLDLLVEPGALSDLHETLLGAGFQPAPQRPSFVPAPACTVYSLPLEGTDTAMEVDIHIGMHWPEEYERRTRFRPEDLWSHAVREEVEGIRIWALSPEHLVITTLLDVAVNHRYARLVKFRDVMEILRATAVDWDEVETWCRRWEVRSFVGPASRYLAEMDGTDPVPYETIERLLPSYTAMRMFLRALPVGTLPDHRSRSFSLANLAFFTLSDRPRARASGLLHVPGHILRGRHRF